MRIGVIGVNHKSADLRLREKLAKSSQRLFSPQHSAHANFSYVLLSTCNRTEVYFCALDLAQIHTYLLSVLREHIQEEFEHRIYSYFGRDCFFHLTRVTAGIDSALIGETEIQGQVKRAYETAKEYAFLDKELHFLFQKSLKVGKEVRREFQFQSPLPSLEEAILNSADALLEDLAQRKMLFVGVSEINHKIFINFKRLGFQNLSFCNRTNEKALKIAEKEGIGHLPWERLSEWSQYDVAVFGTKSPRFLIRNQNLPPQVKCKLVIDLSVPRNVEPGIGRLANLTLLNVDQLNKLTDRKRKLKAEEIGRIEAQLIAEAVDKQVGIFKFKELQRQHSFQLQAFG